MSLVAEHPYVKVNREVTSTGQRDIEEERMLSLYRDKVVTEHRQFPMDHVLDITFRKVGTSGGLLYLHTISGVFSYTVKTSPDSIIASFKIVKHDVKKE